MLGRFLLYGCTGWVLEVCFTGASSALLERDPHATAKTYLWMHPIYGATALGLELIQDRLKFLPRTVRALFYTGVIFGMEFVSGWILQKVLGRTPWEYRGKRWSVKGLIRLDYAPAWYLTALLFEPTREAFLRLTAKALRETAEYRSSLEASQPSQPTPVPQGA